MKEPGASQKELKEKQRRIWVSSGSACKRVVEKCKRKACDWARILETETFRYEAIGSNLLTW